MPWCHRTFEELKCRCVHWGGERVGCSRKAQPVQSEALTTHGYRAPDRHVTLIRVLPLPPQILSLPVVLSPNHCRAQPGSSHSVQCWALLKPNLTEWGRG